MAGKPGQAGCCCVGCNYYLRFPNPCPGSPGTSPFYQAEQPGRLFQIDSVVDGSGNAVPLQASDQVILRPGTGPWTIKSSVVNKSGIFLYDNNPATTVVADRGCPAPSSTPTPDNTIVLTPPTITAVRHTIGFSVPAYFSSSRDDNRNRLTVSPCRFEDRNDRFNNGLDPSLPIQCAWQATGSVAGQDLDGATLFL